MSSSVSTALALLLVSSSVVACMSPQQAPSSTPCPALSSAAPAHAQADRHVYRFDFVLTANDGTAPPMSTAFTLNLQEFDKGEIVVGKNVPLTPPNAPAGTPSPRQDVGIKVASAFRMTGDDVLLDVTAEMSSFEPPSAIRKVVAKGSALASAGKSVVVTTLDDDHKRYQLSVTATRLR